MIYLGDKSNKMSQFKFETRGFYLIREMGYIKYERY